MRRYLALAVLTLAGAAGAAHVDASRAADSEPLTARGTLTPATIRFADTLDAELEVAYDPAHVDGASIRVVPDFAPFAPTAPPAVSHGQRDGLDVLRMRYSLQCVSAGCLPGKTPRAVHFQRGTVTGTRDGRPFEAAQIWPTLRVVSRLSDRASSRGDRLPPSARPARTRLPRVGRSARRRPDRRRLCWPSPRPSR